jgi:hypothetical protein
MGRRKGELTAAGIDQGWPYQVIVRATECRPRQNGESVRLWRLLEGRDFIRSLRSSASRRGRFKGSRRADRSRPNRSQPGFSAQALPSGASRFMSGRHARP